jgi:hypothetical protein
MGLKPRDLALAGLIVLVWGVNFAITKVGLAGLPPMLLGALRFVLAAFPAVLLVRPPRVPLRWYLAYGLTISVGQFALLLGRDHGRIRVHERGRILQPGAHAGRKRGELARFLRVHGKRAGSRCLTHDGRVSLLGNLQLPAQTQLFTACLQQLDFGITHIGHRTLGQAQEALGRSDLLLNGGQPGLVLLQSLARSNDLSERTIQALGQIHLTLHQLNFGQTGAWGLLTEAGQLVGT